MSGLQSPKLPNPVNVSLPISKSAVVVVDMQNDFCRENGELYAGPMVLPTIPKIRTLLEKARSSGLRVIHTQSWYLKDDPRYSNHPRASIIGRGCKAETWGAETIDELKPLPGEPSIKKSSFDPWFGTNMESILKEWNFGSFEHGSVHRNRERNDTNVILTGTVSNACVEKAVIGFYLRGYEIIVPSDCVSANDQYGQEWALHQFTKWYGAKLTLSDMMQFI